MDIIHHIGLNSSKEEKLFITVIETGIEHKEVTLPGGKSKLITFDILESDSRWEDVHQLIEKYHCLNMHETIFSDCEIRSSEWLRLVPKFGQGYPQPASKWPLKQQTYENVCQKCGVYKQANEYRIKKEPSLGRKSFFSPNWVMELFTTPLVVLSLESISAKGFEARNIIIHRTNLPSEKLLQIFILGITKPGLVLDKDMVGTDCNVCGTKKYYYHNTGAMRIKGNSLPTDTDFVKTSEWFGSGLIAFREILISNRIAQLILDNNWMGALLKVIKIV